MDRVEVKPANTDTVRVNLFDIGAVRRPAQNPAAQALRHVSDRIGNAVGDMLNIPETTGLRTAPYANALLRERGIESTADGSVSIPNTAAGGKMFADFVVQAHAPGDASLTPGLGALSKFNDAKLARAGFGKEFIEGFNDEKHAKSMQGLAVVGTTLTGVAARSAATANARSAPQPAKANSPSPRDTTPATDGRTINMRQVPSGRFEADFGGGALARSGGSIAPGAKPPRAIIDNNGNSSQGLTNISTPTAFAPRSLSLSQAGSSPQTPAPIRAFNEDVAHLQKMGWDVSPEQMRNVYPEGGRIPKEFLTFSNEVRRVYGKPAFDELLKHPEALRALTESSSVRFVPGPDGVKLRSTESGQGMTASQYVQNVLAPTGKDAAVQAWLDVADMVKPVFPRAEKRGDFLTSVGSVVDPGTGNKRVFVTMTHNEDHNGALRKESLRGSAEGLTQIPYTELPPESWGNPILLDAHGLTRAVGPGNAIVADSLVAEIVRQTNAGNTIDRVVCLSCSQRDPRKFGLTGESNGHALQNILDQKLLAAGQKPITIYTADMAGLLYKPDSITNLMVGTNKGPVHPTNLAPTQPPTRGETLSAVRNTGLAISGFALSALASAAGGRALLDRWERIPMREPPGSNSPNRAEEQRMLRSDFDRLKQLDTSLTQGATLEIRTEARDELVEFARTLPQIVRDSSSGQLGADSAASKRMVDKLVTDMSERYGLNAASFVGPGGDVDAFPDALAKALDARLK